MFKKLRPGDVITAEYLNEITRLLQGRKRAPVDAGDEVRLFKSVDGFPDSPTPGVFTGECSRLEYSIQDEEFIEYGGPEIVFCLSAVRSPPSAGEVFYALFNRSSGRWEAMGGGGCKCDKVLGVDILTERWIPLSPGALTESLNNYAPACWELTIANCPTNSALITDVDATTNEITLDINTFVVGDSVTLAVIDGALPAPLEEDQSYIVTASSGLVIQLGTQVGGSAIDLTDEGSGSMAIGLKTPPPFLLWYRRDGNSNAWVWRWISNQIVIKWRGAFVPAHWEVWLNFGLVSSAEIGRAILVQDSPINHTSPPVQSAIYSSASWGTSTGVDLLAELPLRLANRSYVVLSNATPDTVEDLVVPFATVSHRACLTPRKYPEFLEDEPPLHQLWGGTPPASLRVSLNGGAPFTISYLSPTLPRGRMDCYGNGSGSPGAQRFSVRAVINDDGVDTTKIMLLDLGGTNLQQSYGSMSRMFIRDFTAPLDVTVTDVNGNTLRFYE